jgi:hypothetical protein
MSLEEYKRCHKYNICAGHEHIACPIALGDADQARREAPRSRCFGEDEEPAGDVVPAASTTRRYPSASLAGVDDRAFPAPPEPSPRTTGYASVPPLFDMGPIGSNVSRSGRAGAK